MTYVACGLVPPVYPVWRPAGDWAPGRVDARFKAMHDAVVCIMYSIFVRLATDLSSLAQSRHRRHDAAWGMGNVGLDQPHLDRRERA